MSAVHRIDDMWAMPGWRFFQLAERLAAYRGVMRARLETEQATNPTSGPRTPPQPLDLNDPTWSRLVDHGTSGRR